MMIVAAVVVIAACVAGILGARWWTWRPLRKHSVLVQTEDGAAFDGVAVSIRGPVIELANVTVRIEGGNGQPVDGRVFIERTRVAFYQVTN